MPDNQADSISPGFCGICGQGLNEVPALDAWGNEWVCAAGHRLFRQNRTAGSWESETASTFHVPDSLGRDPRRILEYWLAEPGRGRC